MKTLSLARPPGPTRSYAALAIVHNQARAHRAYMIRSALYVPFTTPSGVPYGVVERDDGRGPRQVVYYHIGGGCVDSQGNELDTCYE